MLRVLKTAAASCLGTAGSPASRSADGAPPRDVAIAEGKPETAALIERLLAA